MGLIRGVLVLTCLLIGLSPGVLWPKATMFQEDAGAYNCLIATGTVGSQTQLTNCQTTASSLNLPMLLASRGLPTSGNPNGPPITWTISSNLTPSMPLIIPQGAKIQVNAGVTLTLDECPYAGIYQIFYGEGTVLLPTCNPVYAEWWGAKANGTTASAAAITKALHSATANKRVVLQGGVYLVEGKIDVPDGATAGWSLIGQGMNTTVLLRDATHDDAMLQLTESDGGGPIDPDELATGNFVIQDVQFDCVTPEAETVGIKTEGAPANYFVIQRVRVENCAVGLEFNGTTGATLRDMWIQSNTKGLYVHNKGAETVTAMVIADGRFSHNTEVQMEVDGSRGTGLVREIYVHGTRFDGGTATPNRKTVSLIGVETIEFHNAHLEAGDPNLYVRSSNGVEGEDQAKDVRNLVFRHTQFGGLNDEAVGTLTVDWEATGSNDGNASYFEGCRFADGEVRIVSNAWIPFINNSFIGGATLQPGPTLEIFNGDDTALVYRVPDNLVARSRRLRELVWLEPTATRRSFEFAVSHNTTTATGVAILQFDLGVDTAIAADAFIFVKRDTGTDYGMYKRVALLRNEAGTVSEVFDLDQFTPQETSGITSAAVEFQPDNTNSRIELLIQGVAGTNLRWWGTVVIYQISADN